MAIEQPTGFELDYLFEFSPERKEGDGRQDQVRLSEFSTRFFVLAGIFQGEQARYQEGVSRGATRRPEARPYPEMRSTNKLEKSRQSARECRARKKLRYQYLDDMILEREKANDRLREELAKYVGWCQMLDQSQVQILAHSDRISLPGHQQAHNTFLIMTMH